MTRKSLSTLFLQAAVLSAAFLLAGPAAQAQVLGQTDVNTSKKSGNDSECAIAKNPTNKMELFASCNTGTAGLFAARSTDLGVTWTYPDPADKTIADGDAGQGPAACCDPDAGLGRVREPLPDLHRQRPEQHRDPAQHR